jgi:anti-sigma regulatory factor (Ser/Thr protein kinase)
MSSPGCTENTSEAECKRRFARVRVAADATSAARVRAELDGWLRAQVATDAARVSDVLLAVYEGLANAAEYAYLGCSRPGTFDVHAHLDSCADELTVTVTDHGRWRTPSFDTTDPAQRVRGRGIPLMKALASDTSIRTTTAGTQVRLTWTGLGRSGR